MTSATFSTPNSGVPTAMPLEQLLDLNFAGVGASWYGSWTPRVAFEARSQGLVGYRADFETLYEYLRDSRHRSVASTLLLDVPLSELPGANELIRIYRAADASSGAQCGAILPGASVSESYEYVVRHSELYCDETRTILTSYVYPDELVTLGSPHAFTYVPRSVSLGYARYISDVGGFGTLAVPRTSGN